MADRVFAAILLAVVAGYLWLAFTVIRAPFQYDPLGPETWPRILGVVAAFCCLWIIARPGIRRFDATAGTLGRLLFVVALLLAYGWAYERAGFIVSTTLFCWALGSFLGAGFLHAALFGLVTGVSGWFLCTGPLDLNLPEGILAPWL